MPLVPVPLGVCDRERGRLSGSIIGRLCVQQRARAPRVARLRPLKNPSVSGGYFRRSLAAFLALSAPEPPPFFLPLDDLPLEPFFELPPAFSTACLALSMYPNHDPSSFKGALSLFLPCTVVLESTRNRPESFSRPRPPKPTERFDYPLGDSFRLSDHPE